MTARRTLRRSAWYAASAKLRAGGRLSAREAAALRRRGMLHEECRLSGRGEAAYMAAMLGVPVLEMRILASLYAFRRRIERAAASSADSKAAAGARPLPRGMPVSYSALLPLLAGRSPSRMRSAAACLVSRGLAAKRGREQICITDDAFRRLSRFDPQLLAIEALP